MTAGAAQMTHPTDDEIIKYLPIARLTKNPQVWLTQKDAIAAIRRALLAEQARTKPNPIQEVYQKLHAGKVGAHWLWVVIEQIAAGIPEADAMREFGYYAQTHKAEDAPSDAEKDKLLSVLKEVEQWWLTQADKSEGAPACMFAARAAIANHNVVTTTDWEYECRLALSHLADDDTPPNVKNALKVLRAAVNSPDINCTTEAP